MIFTQTDFFFFRLTGPGMGQRETPRMLLLDLQAFLNRFFHLAMDPGLLRPARTHLRNTQSWFVEPSNILL